MHQPLLDRARSNGGGEKYDFAPFFDKIRPYLEKRADLALCHAETPMGPGPPATYPIFNTPADLARSIRKSGFDACSTASNHSLDQGMAGIAGTIAALDKRGIKHTGTFASKRAAGQPTFLRVAGVKIGFVSYTDATNGLRRRPIGRSTSTRRLRRRRERRRSSPTPAMPATRAPTR